LRACAASADRGDHHGNEASTASISASCRGRNRAASRVALHTSARLSDAAGAYRSGWQGIGAPRNTPAEIIDQLNKEVNVALADPNFNARLATLGSAGFPGSPADFGKLVVEETEKWGNVIRAANIRPE
jgi:hypothetical protein